MDREEDRYHCYTDTESHILCVEDDCGVIMRYESEVRTRFRMSRVPDLMDDIVWAIGHDAREMVRPDGIRIYVIHAR